MYSDMQTPQVLYPPPSLQSIPPPSPLYTPPNPATALSFLHNILSLLLHTLLSPFSARLLPAHPSHRYAIELFPAPPQPSTTIVPTRKERRSRSKSPSASPSSATLTEGTLDFRGTKRSG